MYTQCHRSTDTNKMPQKLYIAAGYLIRCVLGGGGGKPPPPSQPPTPAETKPSQAKPSQFKGRPVYLPSVCGQANPIRPQASRAAVLTASLSGTDTAKPSPTHFFQGDHVYESPPSLFRARNPLPRYLYLTQRGPSRVCSRRCTHSAIAPATQTKCHKRFTSQPAIGSGVCLGGRGQAATSPPTPHPR